VSGIARSFPPPLLAQGRLSSAVPATLPYRWSPHHSRTKTWRTPFSSYTYEAATLIRSGGGGLALVYLVGSVLLGMAGVVVGIVAAEWL
jgi:hypothetical protein